MKGALAMTVTRQGLFTVGFIVHSLWVTRWYRRRSLLVAQPSTYVMALMRMLARSEQCTPATSLLVALLMPCGASIALCAEICSCTRDFLYGGTSTVTCYSIRNAWTLPSGICRQCLLQRSSYRRLTLVRSSKHTRHAHCSNLVTAASSSCCCQIASNGASLRRANRGPQP